MSQICQRCGQPGTGSGAFCAQCGTPYPAGSTPNPQQPYPQQPYIPAPAYGSPSAGSRTKASLGLTIPLLLAGILGVACTFMSWLGIGDESWNGWKSAKELRDVEFADYYSYGALLTIITSVVLLLIAGFHLFRSTPYQPNARVSSGILLIVIGIVMVGNAGAQYNAFDQAAKDAGILVTADVGLQLSFVVGAIAVVLGILALAVKSLIPSTVAGATPIFTPPPPPPPAPPLR